MTELKIDKSWTLFLDRDGVINKKLENNYVRNIDEFVFLPKALSTIVECSKLFGKIIIVTNQQGIGKGIMSENDLLKVHQHLTKQVLSRGGKIDAIYFAPELAQNNSALRKPNIGMALKAKKDFPEIDFKKSIMIGDSLSDIEFANNARMHSFLIGQKQSCKSLYHWFNSLP